MAKYQGHRSWAAWNVSLWIANEYNTYKLAQYYVRTSKTLGVAAKKLLGDLPAKTPDGARYTITSVREALVGFDK